MVNYWNDLVSNSQKILNFLKKDGNVWCDDCLSKELSIYPRQQINQIVRKLSDKGEIIRSNAQCTGCIKYKTVNSSSSNKIVVVTPKNTEKQIVKTIDGRPWYWEGNIQAMLMTYLANNNYKIISVSNTESRESGKDIIAQTPQKNTLWISVKGWPEKSVNTQARHWFSQALFDIILYRDESVDVELALAFPDDYSTYLNLAKRITWFKAQAKFRIFWVNEYGSVRIE